MIVQTAGLCSQVVLSGTSYEASAALFTLSRHPKAVKGCLALYPFWYIPSACRIPVIQPTLGVQCSPHKVSACAKGSAGVCLAAKGCQGALPNPSPL